jgi:hypothetical protein
LYKYNIKLDLVAACQIHVILHNFEVIFVIIIIIIIIIITLITITMTAPVVQRSDFLAANPLDPGSIPGAVRFSE